MHYSLRQKTRHPAAPEEDKNYQGYVCVYSQIFLPWQHFYNFQFLAHSSQVMNIQNTFTGKALNLI
jgi:hypothetical protein